MPDDIARAEEKCMERLKSKIQELETSYDFDTARLEEKCERLQKQLEIAIKALEDYAESDNWELENEKYIYWAKKGQPYPWRLGIKALKEIEALNEIHK